MSHVKLLRILPLRIIQIHQMPKKMCEYTLKTNMSTVSEVVYLQTLMNCAN